MALMSNIMGESEKGLIDWNILREQGKNSEITEEEYKMKSMSYLILAKRNRRAGFYKKGKI
jgi:hypothetical protein